MKERLFDLVMIAVMAALLIVLSQFDLLEQYAKYGLIPMLAFYYLGKYSVRKIKN